MELLGNKLSEHLNKIEEETRQQLKAQEANFPKMVQDSSIQTQQKLVRDLVTTVLEKLDNGEEEEPEPPKVS